MRKITCHINYCGGTIHKTKRLSMDCTEQSKTSPATGEAEVVEEVVTKTPDQLLGEGKKCLAAGDPSGAVEAFQEACSILADKHGQISRELAEPYYLYGRALLELARGDSTVLGSAIPAEGSGEGDPAQTSSNDIDGSTNEDSTSAEATASKEDAPASSAGNEPPGPSTDESAEVTSSNDVPGTSAEASGENPATNGTNEEEESDLKLAWEVLELARVICQKEQGDEYKLKLADVSLTLGEVGMESDQYDQAIGDIQMCLQLREFVLEPTDRRLAEGHFSLGLAFSFAKQVDNSISEYKKSKEILEKRINELQKQVTDKTAADDRMKIEQEIKELQELLPDLDAKVADVEELKQVLEEREKEQAEQGEESTTSIGFGDGSNADKETANETANSGDSEKAPVKDITHLIRKRPADEVADSAKKAKRQCLDENVDTTSTTEKLTGKSSNLETVTPIITTAEQ